jgi:hypothetical protein
MNASYNGKLSRHCLTERAVHPFHRGNQDRVACGPVPRLAVAEWNGCASAALPQGHPVYRGGSEVWCRRLPLLKPELQLTDLGCDLGALILQSHDGLMPHGWVLLAVWRDATEDRLLVQLVPTTIKRQQDGRCSVDCPLRATE